MDPHQGQAGRVGVALEDLVRDARDGAAELVGLDQQGAARCGRRRRRRGLGCARFDVRSFPVSRGRS
ncbi:MAG TPA: hypothetical protein VNT51_14230, partial [Miltoncostaeaceae bacterium]|nr:hypothetical protein [Miltoncostaeaceae bacterium]